MLRIVGIDVNFCDGSDDCPLNLKALKGSAWEIGVQLKGDIIEYNSIERATAAVREASCPVGCRRPGYAAIRRHVHPVGKGHHAA